MTTVFKADVGPSLGIDLGGTTMTAIVRGQGKSILATKQADTDMADDVGATLRCVAELVHQVLTEARINADALTNSGFALPGEVDTRNGVFNASPILPQWRQVPVVKLMQDLTKIHFTVDNDANATLLAETVFGAARDIDPVMLLTIGTGIGGAIKVGDRIVTGHQYSAGEIGHVCVESDGDVCWCGAQGCCGLYASTTALLRYYDQLKPDTAPACADGLSFSQLFFAKDATAINALDTMCLYLAHAIASAASVLAPRRIILFGGILSGLAEPIVTRVTRSLAARPYPSVVRAMDVVVAQSGRNAGALGASLLSATDELDHSVN